MPTFQLSSGQVRTNKYFQPCTAKKYTSWKSKVGEDYAHFLSRKTKLKMRKTIVMMIPKVARKPSVTVTARCTVTVSFIGTPSYGIPSTVRQENEDITVCNSFVPVSFKQAWE